MSSNYSFCACTSWNNKNPTGLRYAVLETGVRFEVFDGMKGQNNPEENSNTKYRSEPQYILWDIFT